MAIEDRNLAVGVKLAAKYKKQVFTCEVVQTEEGVRYRLADGQTFKSPSAAGSAVMNGAACNGWKFWSLATEGAPGGETEPEGQGGEAVAERRAAADVGGTVATRSLAARIIKRTPNQHGSPEGQDRWFCGACGNSFFAPTGAAPEACPKGHQALTDPNGDLVTVAVAQAASDEQAQAPE